MGIVTFGEGRPLAARTGRRQAGFSFVEVLIVTIVIGLLAAIAIPSFLGTRDQATGAGAQSLLRTAASAVESVAVDTDGYGAITPAALASIEPSVAWLDAPGAQASTNEVSVTDLGESGYALTTTTGAGSVYTLVKDLAGAPTVTRTCGPDCSW